MIDEMDVARLMRVEAESTERPSAVVNVERAMTAGRRRRWYVRSAVATVALAVVTVGGATVPGLFAADSPTEPSLEQFAGPKLALDPYTGPVPSPDESRIPAALQTVDPEIQYVRFGWLPSGLDSVHYQAGLLLRGPGVALTGQAPETSGSTWAGVSVSLYPQGVEPPAPQVTGIDARAPELDSTPAPEIRGEPATFTLFEVDEGVRLSLRWQYAPNGWATVDVSPWEDGQDLREIAVRVAQSLRFSTTEKVRLPVPVSGVPERLRLINTSLSGSLGEDGGRWYAGRTYTAAPATEDPGRQRANTLEVDFSPYVELTDETRAELNGKEPPEPNTTIDGHPAYYASSPEQPVTEETLTVFDVAGLNVHLYAGQGLLDAQGVKGLFRQLDVSVATPDWRPTLVVD